MEFHRGTIRTIAMALGVILPISSFGACETQSGPMTAAWVELYTSEGCSSCPPAEQQINRLRQTLTPTADIVLLALHVNYWDYLGWKDSYAKGSFSDRQSALVHANRHSTVYTPQVFLNGVEIPSWGSGLRSQVMRLNAQPAVANIHLRANRTKSGALAVGTEAKSTEPSDSTGLYLAITESGLVSTVTKGENSGETLTHDYVVREWIGPIHLSRGEARMRREIALPPTWNRTRLEIVAFIQDEHSGRVLQAVSTKQCGSL